MLMFLTVPFFLGFPFSEGTHILQMVWELQRPCSLGILKCQGSWGPGERQAEPRLEVPLPDSGKPGVEKGLPCTDFSHPGQHESFVPGTLAEGELSAGAHGARISRRRSTAQGSPGSPLSPRSRAEGRAGGGV